MKKLQVNHAPFLYGVRENLKAVAPNVKPEYAFEMQLKYRPRGP